MEDTNKSSNEIKELADGIFANCPAGLFGDECEMIARYVIEENGYCKASDVIKKIFEEIKTEIEAALANNYKARSAFEFSNELYQWVQGKIDALRGMEDFIDELKEKYAR